MAYAIQTVHNSLFLCLLPTCFSNKFLVFWDHMVVFHCEVYKYTLKDGCVSLLKIFLLEKNILTLHTRNTQYSTAH